MSVQAFMISLVIMANVRITAWNIRSLSCARPYMNELLELKSDVLFIAEHRLYEQELHKLDNINENYNVVGKSSNDLEMYEQGYKLGHCGVAMFWHKQLGNQVKPIKCNSDRICAIEIMNTFGCKSLVVVGVYLPQQRCKISSFDDHLIELEQLICRVKPHSEICIIGDFNCHFGEQVGNRFWGKTTPNAAKCKKLIDANDMCIIDSQTSHCNGPGYTFYVEGVGKSYVDHCVMSSYAQASVTDCIIMEDCVTNTSDHLPITVTINTSPDTGKSQENCKKEKVAWSKLSEETITERYTKPLDNKLAEVYVKMTTDETLCKINEENACVVIDSYLSEIVEIIKDVTDCMPKSKFQKHLKPYWNDKVNTANKTMKSVRRDWIRKGKRRGDDEAFKRLKEAKKSFRYCQKEAEKQYELKNMEDICNSQEVDETFFWYLVNRGRGIKKKSNNVHPIKLPSGKVITDPDEIRDNWKIYFEELYTPKDPKEYDSSFKLFIEKALIDLECQSYTNDDECMKAPITEDEVLRLCNSLKCKKAPGWDGVTSEQIKFGGEFLIKCLSWLFNKITLYEHIPGHFKRGVIVAIPKGNKDKQLQDNHRGITLIPVMAKLYEKCIMKRIEKSKQFKEAIDRLQGVTQENCSSLHIAWLMKEVISCHIEKGSTVYVGLLDIKKAYDTVWQEGMLYKLFHYGINGKTWRLIRNFYKKFMCQVQFGSLSELFEALQGIHQGAPCSTLFFALFENELLQIIQNLKGNVQIHNVNVSCPAFADDVSFIATSKNSLQSMFNSAYDYACKWRFTYSPQKCKVVIFGKDESPGTKVKLGENVIMESKCEHHLGLGLCTNKKEELDYVINRISACRPVLFSMKCIGSKHVPVSAVTASKLYWSVCIPKLTYGIEVMNVSSTCVDALESFHQKSAKYIQGLPDQANNIGSLVTVGWKPLEFYLDFLRLTFLWRILMLPMVNVYKVVLLRRILHLVNCFNPKACGPVKTILDTCIKYNLQLFVLDAVTSGNYCSMIQWKKMIKHKIAEKYQQQVRATLPLFRSLKALKLQLCISPWLVNAHMCPSRSKESRLILQLLLKKDRYKHTFCHHCDTQARISTSHILFDCTHLNKLRQELWKDVESTGPPTLIKELNCMTAIDKCDFVLNGFYTRYTKEWKPLYMRLSRFIYKLVKSHENI